MTASAMADDDRSDLRPAFAVAVDLVGLEVRGEELRVLLIKRGREPFKGMWALPGGLVQGDLGGHQESLEDAVRRQFEATTGLPLDAAYMTQLGTYGDPGRDPRGNVVTVAYLAVAPAEGQPQPGEDVVEAEWRPLGLGDDLAFDHARIIEDAVERVRDLIATTALAIAFCDEWFTMPYLRRIYEVIWDLEPNALDSGNFHSRVTGMRGLVEPVDARESTGGRPRQFFTRGPLIQRSGPAARLERPIDRPWESRHVERITLAPQSTPREGSETSERPRPVIDRPRDMKPKAWEAAKQRVRSVLWQRGLAGEGIYYGELASEVGLHWHSGGFFAVLDAVSVEEVTAGGPMVTALVMNRRAAMPGERFFVLAERLGRTVTDVRELVEEERRAAIEWIRAHPERAGITEA